MRRYELDPQRVRESVLGKCAEYWLHRTRLIRQTLECLERYNQDPKGWYRKPDPTYIGPMYDAWVEKERTHYANVYIIEDGGFTLRYTEGATRGTGPFRSLQAAENWFYRGGR